MVCSSLHKSSGTCSASGAVDLVHFRLDGENCLLACETLHWHNRERFGKNDCEKDIKKEMAIQFKNLKKLQKMDH